MSMKTIAHSLVAACCAVLGLHAWADYKNPNFGKNVWNSDPLVDGRVVFENMTLDQLKEKANLLEGTMNGDSFKDLTYTATVRPFWTTEAAFDDIAADEEAETPRKLKTQFQAKDGPYLKVVDIEFVQDGDNIKATKVGQAYADGHEKFHTERLETSMAYTYCIYSLTMRKTEMPDVAVAWNIYSGSSARGWFSGLNNYGSLRTVGPNEYGLAPYSTGDNPNWNPWNSGAVAQGKTAFTFSAYVNVEAGLVHAGEHSTIWCLGFGKSNNSLQLALDGNRNLKLLHTSGSTIHNGETAPTIAAANLKGFHLVTATYSQEDGITLTLDGDTENTQSDDSEGAKMAISNQIQIGGIPGGLPSGFWRGDNVAYAAIVGYDQVLSADQIKQLAVDYPAVDMSDYTVTYQIAADQNIVKMDSGITTFNSFAPNYAGTITVKAGTVKVPNNVKGTYKLAGGTYEFTSVAGNDYNKNLIMAGGTLKAVNEASPNANAGGSIQFYNVTFEADSTVEADARLYSLSNGYHKLDFNLNGHKLTKTGASAYILRTPNIVGGGTLKVEEGHLGLDNAMLAADDTLTIDVAQGATLDFANYTTTDATETTMLDGTIKLAAGSFRVVSGKSANVEPTDEAVAAKKVVRKTTSGGFDVYTLVQTYTVTLGTSSDERVKTQYKIGEGEWTDYSEPIVVDDDGSVYFQYVAADPSQWTVEYSVSGLYFTHIKGNKSYNFDESKLTVTSVTPPTPPVPGAIEGGSQDQQSEYAEWATANGVSGSTTSELAAAFAIGAEGEDEESVLEDAQDELVVILATIDLTKITTEAFTLPAYPNATFQFVEASLGEGVTTTANLFRLTVEFLPANSQSQN